MIAAATPTINVLYTRQGSMRRRHVLSIVYLSRFSVEHDEFFILREYKEENDKDVRFSLSRCARRSLLRLMRPQCVFVHQL